MSIVRRIARPLLATGYIVNGIDSFRNSSTAAEHLDPALKTVRRAVPQAAPALQNSAVVAQGLAAAQVGAAALFALGKAPRLASTVLISTTAVNAYLDFRAADNGTKEERAARRNSGLKNVSLVGATMLAAVDTDGSPSLMWRAEHFVSDVQRQAQDLSKDASKRWDKTQKAAAKKAKKTKKSVSS
ncbi:MULTISPECIES: DoxX family membrane protein [Kocuria]|uniref:DoxX family membrane protein n=1 Tax=Kocuria subflava TaxID=1736139 RepID=A0A846U933_9MICC|nr:MULTISPECIES: DoxX family membrane protein [Kocuria]NKE10066.1 DoxX family membrane protein [Kocuria subflava]